MPTEIFDTDEFVGLSEKAEYCAVKRLEEIVYLDEFGKSLGPAKM